MWGQGRQTPRTTSEDQLQYDGDDHYDDQDDYHMINMIMIFMIKIYVMKRNAKLKKCVVASIASPGTSFYISGSENQRSKQPVLSVSRTSLKHLLNIAYICIALSGEENK